MIDPNHPPSTIAVGVDYTVPLDDVAISRVPASSTSVPRVTSDGSPPFIVSHADHILIPAESVFPGEKLSVTIGSTTFEVTVEPFEIPPPEKLFEARRKPPRMEMARVWRAAKIVAVALAFGLVVWLLHRALARA